ncbi:MAG TPA: NADPH-dependent assimilatory sulfite reductase hemoprotein subunit [Holophagaceae bacterium]|nr:NADPH-dependent assimilatory sulfite reductase hemoprotein subunit [Holophagaceae bacterium]
MSAPQESAIESLKRGSHGLRGGLAAELASAEPGFSSDAQQLIKLHGLYQQKDRDRRGDPANPPVLLLRGRIPGGRLQASQYLAWDRLAGLHGDGTLRLTTRQSIELHGVLKGEVKAALAGLHSALQTTQDACGDVVRNVTQAPNPWGRSDLAQLDAVAESLSTRFLARSNAYAEIWLDGERVDPDQESEPLLGAAYLPRKFKIAVTAAGDNLVDLYTNDLAFAATFGADGLLDGCFVFAGGGLGMTHNDPTTFPRLADALGWIPSGALLAVAEAVVGTQRDFGNRADRRRARLKYLIAKEGLPWFKIEVESRWGGRFEDRPLPPWNTRSVLGWIHREDGRWALGFHTLSGRIADREWPLRATLRDLVENFNLDVQITPDQDLILLGITAEDRPRVQALLRDRGIDPASPDRLHDRALACVALPLCGLAITEAERALPDFLRIIGKALDRYGLAERAPVFRVTGCANGCARPYTAELALVGQAPGKFALYVGGHAEGSRLAFEVAQKLTVEALPETFDRLFAFWKAEGVHESFGDFAARVGREALLAPLQAALQEGPD